MPSQRQCKVALTGDVALEVVSSYFRDAGFDVMPQDSPPDEFRPDFTYDVTSREEVLSQEVEGFFDPRMKALSGCGYSASGIRAIVEEFSWYRLSNASSAAPKKILAVDADDTLWRGTLGEDGDRGLVPCADFQKGLAELRDDGVVIVLLSKNDPFGETKLPIDRAIFSAEKVNWEPKPRNLAEACSHLGLFPDSVVFLDDNALERAEMEASLPEVTVAPWSGWKADPSSDSFVREQSQLVRRLREYFFSGAGRTEEDRLRAEDYVAEEKRVATQLKSASRDEYLGALGLWVEPSVAGEDDLERLVQMAGKTNRFNATTIRRTREDFERLLASPDYRVFTFRAGDRFGKQGLVLYVVVDLKGRRITDFVMSCRAMGRTLEDYALIHVVDELGYRPEIDYVPTEKNAPFGEFLRRVKDERLETRYTEI